MGRSLNEWGYRSLYRSSSYGGAHAIWRAEMVRVAPPRRHPLVDTPCSAVVPCPEEVRITCDSTGSAFTPCAPSCVAALGNTLIARSEEHTSELQSLRHLVCRLLL